MASNAKTSLIAIGIILTLFAIGGINKARQPVTPDAPGTTPTVEATKGPNKTMMFLVAQKAVKDRLRDPDSADFRNEQLGYKDGTPIVVCGEVNAKNGFGGMTGYQRYMSNGADVTALESEMQNSDISEAWRAMGCR